MIKLSKVANVKDFESKDFKLIYDKYGISGISPDVPIDLSLLKSNNEII